MSNNDITLLNQILENTSVTAPAGLDDSEIFEYFSAEQILKDYDLSSDEILAGITGGSGDGGIDGFYVFADENLIDEDSDFSRLPSGYSLEIYILQSKTTTGFSEEGFDKLLVSSPILLNLTENLDESLYNQQLIERVNIFRELFKTTARKFPKINVNVAYVSKGSTTNIDRRVIAKSESLKTQIPRIIGAGSTGIINFYGARELLDLARKQPSRTLELEYINSASRPGQNSYIALVPIKAYSEFLTDGSGKLKKFIFESNVRDFQGNTQVNNAIRESLAAGKADDELDFWWLNNGITVLSTQVSITGGKFILKDPQIVNGLQSSVSIYEHFKSAPVDVKDERSLLIRIIESSNDDIRNKVIVATNSQTTLLPSAIRATDILQRDIEQYFLTNGYFYDRRKNYYKNLGKQAEFIVAVPYLAQAVLSIGYSEPNNARARPSSLIGSDAEYRRIFDSSTPMIGYLWMAKLQKKVDNFLRNAGIDRSFKSNMRFHLSMLVAHRILGDVIHNPHQLEDYFDKETSEENFLELANELNTHLDEFLLSHPDFTKDRAAKSQDFVDYLIS